MEEKGQRRVGRSEVRGQNDRQRDRQTDSGEGVSDGGLRGLE